MNKEMNIQTIFNNFFVRIKKNFYLISFFIIILFLMIFSIQYFFYYQDKKIYEMSIEYENAKKELYSKNITESMESLVDDSGIYGLLSSLDLIKNNLNKKNYNITYEKYLILLNDKKLNSDYNSIIALNGAYNLIDYISSEKILNLLTFVDKTNNAFIGYYEELLYLIYIKNNEIKQSNEILEKILNNKNIAPTIKERLKKLNDFQKYK